ncbi:CLU domain [Phytophthora cactorum]|nr:CLU domain [Phytophthora cactorum]
MHQLMLEAGKSEEDLAAEKEQEALGVAPMSGGEASTEVATICGAVEAKGIQGSDGRLYVLDLVRITPKDWTFYKNREAALKSADEKKVSAPEEDGLCFTRDDEGYAALLRPELVQLYSLWKENQARRANREARKAPRKPRRLRKRSRKTKKDSEENEQEEEEEEEEIPPLLLNPNVFMDYAASTDSEQLDADEVAAKDAAEYMQRIVVPAFVADVRRGAIAPADGYALTQLMHSCGINMRYLGRLASLAKKLEAISGISKYLLEMLEVEMIARVAKHILADVLNSNDSIRAAPGTAIVKLLNGILGSSSAAAVDKTDEANGTDAITTSSLDAKTLLALWGLGRDESRGEDAAFPVGRVNKSVMLRRLCQRLGLRVVSRNYEFSSSSPISLDDITGVVPVVKTSCLHTPWSHALEPGHSVQCVRTPSGGVVSAFPGVWCSPRGRSSLQLVARDCALPRRRRCWGYCAAAASAGAVHAAPGHRLPRHGLRTANLALFLHANAQTDLAVPHIRRAIYLLEFCCGPHFPEISSLYFKMGMMCQDVGQITLALMCHRESLRRGEFDRSQAANVLHQMALACSLAGGYREALMYEKKVYSLMKEAFGDEDPRVIESTKFMAKFTEKAVEGAKAVGVDAAEAADAIANELLGELEFKTEANHDAGSPPAAKKKKPQVQERWQEALNMLR